MNILVGINLTVTPVGAGTPARAPSRVTSEGQCYRDHERRLDPACGATRRHPRSGTKCSARPKLRPHGAAVSKHNAMARCHQRAGGRQGRGRPGACDGPGGWRGGPHEGPESTRIPCQRGAPYFPHSDFANLACGSISLAPAQSGGPAGTSGAQLQRPFGERA